MRERDELSSELKQAVMLLRELPEPSGGWRGELLRRVGEPDLPFAPPAGRRWSVRPLHGIAAALCCALVGAGATALALRSAGDHAPPLSVAPAAFPVRFALVAPTALRVSIVGDFNRWDATALPLRRSADGRTWEVEVKLQPGLYSYAFLIDGRLARDSTAPQNVGDDFGTPNSIVTVKGS
jgi:hypothetical protein